MNILKKVTALCLLGSCLSFFVGCSEVDPINPALDSSKKVTLTVAIRVEQDNGISTLARSFMKKYNNCHIKIEYVQDYDEALSLRFKNKLSPIDLFFSSGPITSDNPVFAEQAYNLREDSRIDLSQCSDEIINEFVTTSNGNEVLYSVPLGEEVYGLFVNMDILNEHKFLFPTTYATLINECRSYKNSGGTPIKSTVESCAMNLFYPELIGAIANPKTNKDVEKSIRKGTADVSTFFSSQFKSMYALISDDYFNHSQTLKNEGIFQNNSRQDMAHSFLNIKQDENMEFYKKNDYGNTLFMPGISSLQPYILKTISDYNMKTSIKFMLPPSADHNTAVLTPKIGMAINKESSNLDWAIEFFNYFFKRKNNILYNGFAGLMPNTSDYVSNVASYFEIDERYVILDNKYKYSYSLKDGTTTDFETIMKNVMVDILDANNVNNYIIINGEKQKVPLDKILANSLESVWKSIVPTMEK